MKTCLLDTEGYTQIIPNNDFSLFYIKDTTKKVKIPRNKHTNDKGLFKTMII